MAATDTGSVPLVAGPAATWLPGTDEHCGWVLLLPLPAAEDRLLCIEWRAASYSHVLAAWYPAVTAIQYGGASERVELVEYAGGVETSRSALDAPRADALPLRPGSFSGVVVRSATGSARGLSQRELFRLLDDCRPYLAPSAFAYIEFANRWSVGKLSALRGARLGDLKGGMARGTVLRGLAARGWQALTVQAGIIERERLVELIPVGGYTTRRKGETLGGLWKQRLLGPTTARLFAPMFAVVAATSVPRPSICERLLEHAGQMVGRAASRASPGGAWRQFNVSRGKGFVEYAVDGGGGAFVVVPMNADMIARRRRELGLIERLRESGLAIARLLPAFTREGHFLGHPYFVLETREGRTVDAHVAGLAELTEAAAQLLLDFNRESAREVRVGAAEFRVLAGEALAGLARLHPWAGAVTARLSELLWQRLMDRTVRTVWLHGDYKLENLVFELSSARIVGVLDWELSAPLGLPMLDALYLFAYDSVTRGEAMDVLDVIERHVLTGTWSDPAGRLLERHRRALGVEPPDLAIAETVFVIHHIGMRFTYYAADPRVRSRLSALLQLAADRLEAAPVRASS